MRLSLGDVANASSRASGTSRGHGRRGHRDSPSASSGRRDHRGRSRASGTSRSGSSSSRASRARRSPRSPLRTRSRGCRRHRRSPSHPRRRTGADPSSCAYLPFPHCKTSAFESLYSRPRPTRPRPHGLDEFPPHPSLTDGCAVPPSAENAAPTRPQAAATGRPAGRRLERPCGAPFPPDAPLHDPSEDVLPGVRGR